MPVSESMKQQLNNIMNTAAQANAEAFEALMDGGPGESASQFGFKAGDYNVGKDMCVHSDAAAKIMIDEFLHIIHPVGTTCG